MTSSRLRFGVNYVPSRHWWYSWVDWDAKAIADDLRAIAMLGMDHIRIHCLWPLFQPNSAYVSEIMLQRLGAFMEMADECNLDVCVTVLNGWLSGFVFLPNWVGPLWDGTRRNIFTDPEVIAAQHLLFTAIAQHVGAHPRFLGFDLGNELGVLQSHVHPVASADADAWATAMLAHCETLLPGKLHVNGVDHGHWFADHGFSREQLATTGAATALHTWIKFTGALERYEPLGVGSLHLAEYCIEFARAYQSDLNRPIWIQEFGCSSVWMAADLIPHFAEQTVRHALSCEGVWGFTWWCSHDLNPQLRGFDQLEYDLGLFDHENRLKPIGREVARLIATLREERPQPTGRTVALVIDDEPFQPTQPQPDWRVAAKFMALVADGIRPAIVLKRNAQNAAYCQLRNLQSFIE
jgi:hypothetical protein